MTRPTAMPNDSKPALTPKLRFPEFRDGPGWEERRVKDVCELNPSNGKLPETFFYIDLESVERGQLKAKTLVNKSEAPSRAQRLLEVGDVIFQIVRPYQRNNLFFNLRDSHPFVASTGYAQLRAHESKPFLYHAIHTDQFVSRVMAHCTGSSYPAINSSDLAEIPLATPSSAEQQKIAECLSTLDELIGAESQKLDALKAHKKGLMQQLFPREGETRPRLRFPEFQNAPEWEEKSIGDFGDIVTGSTPSTAKREYYDGDIPFVSPADISELRFVETTKTTLSELGFEETRPIRAGSVVFVCIGSTIGKVAQVRRDSATNQQINSVVPTPDHDDAFVYYALVKNAERVAKLAGKQAVPIVNKSLFSSVRLPVPKQAEQHRIATCLSSLDDLIAAQSDRLAALRTHKQGLLQQLFPVAGENA